MPQLYEETKRLEDGHFVTMRGTMIMGDFRGWVAADQVGDLEKAYMYLAKIVRAWDFKKWVLPDPDKEGEFLPQPVNGEDTPGAVEVVADPSVPKDYDCLTLPQYNEIARNVGAFITAAAKAKN